MLRKCILLLLVVPFLWASPVRAQFDGPVPVVDVEANPLHWPLQLARMLTEIRIMTRQLDDMLKQARKGRTGDVGAIGALLEELAEIQLGDSILYGHSASEIWPEVYQFDEVFPGGGWLEGSLKRGRRAMNTGRSIMRQLERLRQSEIDDEGLIVEIIGAISTADARNEFLPAIGAGTAVTANLGRKNHQALMSIANQLAVTNAQAVNEKYAEEGQERWFVSNGNQRVPFPEFVDRGL